MKRQLLIKEMVLCSMFTVLIAVGAFIKIPIPVVPFTLQYLFTLMAGLLLGAKLGAISCTIYMFLGLVGLPIFAEGGGFWYVFKPSFGYIIGFVLGTLVTGLITQKMEKFSFKRVIIANFVGLMIVYLVGMIYYYIICNFVIETPIDLKTLIKYCFLLAVPGDAVICVVGAFLAKKLRPITREVRVREDG